MPIKDELKDLYKTDQYYAVCAVVDARARGRCELCACPHGVLVIRHFGTLEPGPSGPDNPRVMYWRKRRYFSPWIDQWGNEIKGSPPDLWEGNKPAQYHHYENPEVLTHAHWNQDPEDNRPENVRLVCGWHHNTHDCPVRAVHAAETRKAKKDAQRPLLAAMEGEH